MNRPRSFFCLICRQRIARPSVRALGFTLVEVLVALAIMAVLAGMAWRGIDGLLRVREQTRSHAEAALRLATVIAQWGQDINHIQEDPAAPPLKFDGSALRLTRRSPEGMQVVVWTRQESHLYRWVSTPTVREAELQQMWLRALQWAAIRPEALAMLDEVTDWQVFYFRDGDNNWSNAQSSGDTAGGDNPFKAADLLPQGVRLKLRLALGEVTRDMAVRR